MHSAICGNTAMTQSGECSYVLLKYYVRIGWEILRKFWQVLMKNQLKNCVFILFLGNFVAKNRNFANNIILLQQFFSGSGERVLTSPNPSSMRTPYFSKMLTNRGALFSSLNVVHFEGKFWENFWKLWTIFANK